MRSVTPPSANPVRRGFSLLELSLAAGIALVLSVALTGVLAAGAKTVDIAARPIGSPIESFVVLLRRDIVEAIRIPTHTAQRLVLLHADGTHGTPDGQPDEIAWDWNSAAGTLTRSVEGVPHITLENVADIQLRYTFGA